MAFNILHMTPLVSGSGVAPPFNPATDIPGINVWQDAADPATIVLSGSDITKWINKAPGGTDFTVQVASPTYATNVQNGLNCVNFSNASAIQTLGTNTSPLFTSTVGFFAAFVLSPITDNLNLCFNVNNELGTQITGFGLSNNSAYGNLLMAFSDGTNAGFTAVTPNGFDGDLLNKFNTFMFTYDGSGLSTTNPGGFGIYFNGVPLTLTLPLGVGPQPGNNAIGGWGVNGNRTNGYFAEAIFANIPATPTIITNTQAYYKNKWATP